MRVESGARWTEVGGRGGGHEHTITCQNSTSNLVRQPRRTLTIGQRLVTCRSGQFCRLPVPPVAKYGLSPFGKDDRCVMLNAARLWRSTSHPLPQRQIRRGDRHQDWPLANGTAMRGGTESWIWPKQQRARSQRIFVQSDRSSQGDTRTFALGLAVRPVDSSIIIIMIPAFGQPQT